MQGLYFYLVFTKPPALLSIEDLLFIEGQQKYYYLDLTPDFHIL